MSTTFHLYRATALGTGETPDKGTRATAKTHTHGRPSETTSGGQTKTTFHEATLIRTPGEKVKAYAVKGARSLLHDTQCVGRRLFGPVRTAIQAAASNSIGPYRVNASTRE